MRGMDRWAPEIGYTSAARSCHNKPLVFKHEETTASFSIQKIEIGRRIHSAVGLKGINVGKTPTHAFGRSKILGLFESLYKSNQTYSQ